jgi:hypothetical protein
MKKIARNENVKYVFLVEPEEYFKLLSDEQLIDFLGNTSFVEGEPLGWGLYRFNGFTNDLDNNSGLE